MEVIRDQLQPKVTRTRKQTEKPADPPPPAAPVKLRNSIRRTSRRKHLQPPRRVSKLPPLKQESRRSS